MARDENFDQGGKHTRNRNTTPRNQKGNRKKQTVESQSEE